MPPQWNSSGLLGGPERRHGDRRSTERGTADRRSRARRRRMRTAVLAAAMSSAPMARPVIALLPPHSKTVTPNVDVSAEYMAVPANEAYDDIIQEAAAMYDMDPQSDSRGDAGRVRVSSVRGVASGRRRPDAADAGARRRNGRRATRSIRARTSWAACAISSGCSIITTATSIWRSPATTPVPATSSATAACRRFARPATTSRPSNRS